MVRKICNILSTILLILVGIIAVALLLPRVFGYQSFAVLSGSMTPGIPVGSVVYAKEVAWSELEVDDVITYQISSDTMVTHRITQKNEETQSLTTKGDANDNEDGNPVSYSQVIGEVDFHLPLLGYVSLYIRTPIGIGALAIALILLVFLPEIISPSPKKEKKGAKEDA